MLFLMYRVACEYCGVTRNHSIAERRSVAEFQDQTAICGGHGNNGGASPSEVSLLAIASSC